MLVRILQPISGSPNGIMVIHYTKGQVCDLPDSLASVFLSIKAAEVFKEEMIESRMMPAAPENKMLESKEEVKEVSIPVPPEEPVFVEVPKVVEPVSKPKGRKRS